MGVVSPNGGPNVECKITSQNTSWKRFETRLTQHTTSGMFSPVLRNIEDNTITDYYTNIGSLWFNRHSEVQEWLRERERVRLDPDNMEGPDTKWVAVGFSSIDTKVVHNRQTLMGTGPLPEWLRNLAHGRAMVALDNYKDNLCLWCCIAVHRGFLPHRSTLAARELAKSFFKLEAKPVDVEKTSLDELEKVEKHLNKNVPFSEWIGIMVYEPEQGVDGELTWFLRRSPPAKLENILTIGIHNGHAFVIKDIAKLAKTYACVNCQARFTKACNLQPHVQRCSQGKTVVYCLGERVEAPQRAYEKAFFPQHSASTESLWWLEREAERQRIHIHHVACGHGGERWIGLSELSGTFHKSLQPTTACAKVFPRKDGGLLSGGKSRSPTESIREGVLSPAFSIHRIALVVGTRSRMAENSHSPCGLWSRRRAVD